MTTISEGRWQIDDQCQIADRSIGSNQTIDNQQLISNLQSEI